MATRNLEIVQKACSMGTIVTPRASEIQGIPLEGGLAVWIDDRWWTPGAMRAAGMALDWNSIMGTFGNRQKLWRVRVWTPVETIGVWNDLSATAPIP